MTEDELVRLLDGDDDAALQVCADWLEGNGQIPAATLLRLEYRLRTQPRPRDLMALGAEVSALATRTPARWLTALARRSPLGQWHGHDSDREKWGFRYLADGTLHYTNSDDTHKDGVWVQIGSVLVMSTNKKFTSYVGFLAEDQIVGAARTVNKLAWTWEVTPASSPKRPKLRARRPDKARREEFERASKPKKRVVARPRTLPGAKKAAKPLPKKVAKPRNKR